MKAPSNPVIERLLGNPEVRAQFRAALKSRGHLILERTQDIKVTDTNSQEENKTVTLRIGPIRPLF